MFDEPSEPNDPNEESEEHAFDPAHRAKEKSDEFRMHAELAAVFEGTRKLEAQIIPALDGTLARVIQQGMAKLEKTKSPEHPVLPPESVAQAADLLNAFDANDLSTNDYHIHRRPGEVMIVRWIQGDEVQAFYERIQAHFDAALEGCKEDERQAHEWKKDTKTDAYLAELDKIDVKMAERYLREPIKKYNFFVLSTQTADEINIRYLSEYIMEIPPEELVGRAAAPPEEPADHDLAWFFKLFSLRGMREDTEQMCFFTYLQKAEDTFDSE